MDESRKKVLIGILITVVAGAFLYFIAFGAATSPDKGVSDVGAESNRPVGDGMISPEASVIGRTMIGEWRSTDDQKFTREFKENGTFVDRYEGDESATKEGIWGVFTADMAAAGTTTGLSSGMVYLQITIGGTSLYFVVTKAADTLEMAYLDRGGQLNFTRVP